MTIAHHTVQTKIKRALASKRNHDAKIETLHARIKNHVLRKQKLDNRIEELQADCKVLGHIGNPCQCCGAKQY